MYVATIYSIPTCTCTVGKCFLKNGCLSAILREVLLNQPTSAMDKLSEFVCLGEEFGELWDRFSSGSEGGCTEMSGGKTSGAVIDLGGGQRTVILNHTKYTRLMNTQ